MIPKIFHYIWLSNEKNPRLPLDYEINLKITHKFNPEYKIIFHVNNLLNTDSIPFITQEIISDGLLNFCRKDLLFDTNYTKYSDYLRLFYMARDGGIYADCDVMFLKSLDDLLDNHIVISETEDRCPQTASATFMCEPHSDKVKYIINNFTDICGKDIIKYCDVTKYIDYIRIVWPSTDDVLELPYKNSFAISYFDIDDYVSQEIEIEDIERYAIHIFHIKSMIREREISYYNKTYRDNSILCKLINEIN